MATAACWRRRRRADSVSFILGDGKSLQFSTGLPQMNFRFLLAAAIAATLASGAAEAGARQKMQAFTVGLKGLDGHFDQRVFDSEGRVTESSSGTVKVAAPRSFRWETRKPSPQLVVADGDQVWIYDPDLEQVTVRNQSAEEQSSPLSVLIDPTELDRQYKVSEGGSAGGLDWLVLAPRQGDEASFTQARLGFGAAGLVRMELRDSLGQRTVIGFGPWQRNPKFSAGTFRFTPPPGTDVVGTPVTKAQVTPLKD
jgi:outer membrane lipoprotein carrier protein